MTRFIRAIYTFSDGTDTWDTKVIMDIERAHHLSSAQASALLLPVGDDAEEDAFYVQAGEWKGGLMSPPPGVRTVGEAFTVKASDWREEVRLAWARGKKEAGWRDAKPSSLTRVRCDRCCGTGYKCRYPNTGKRKIATFNCPTCGGRGEVYRYVVDAE